MTTQRPSFMPLTPEIDDERLDRLAREKGISELVKPATQDRAGEKPVPTPAARSRPEPRKSAPAEAAHPSPTRNYSLDLPAYLLTELKLKGVHGDTSVRYLILKALRNDGYTIADVDLVEDGHRIRGDAA